MPCAPTLVSAPCFSLTHDPRFSAFLCWKKHISSHFLLPRRDWGYCAWDPAEAKVFKEG